MEKKLKKEDYIDAGILEILDRSEDSLKLKFNTGEIMVCDFTDTFAKYPELKDVFHKVRICDECIWCLTWGKVGDIEDFSIGADTLYEDGILFSNLNPNKL